MKTPICTVLLISYNHGQYIEKCIKSVLEQKTQYPFKIHIFDDASTDATAGIIRQYAERYPDRIIPFIADENMGAQANIWRAYQSVDTTYCCLTETDDYWCDPRKLDRQIKALESNPDCSFCCTNSRIDIVKDNYLFFRNHQNEIGKGTFKHNIVTYEDIEGMTTGFLTHISTRLVRMSCVELDKLMYKESFLFDAAQFFYLMTKGDMYWIDRVCSVYLKTGTGVCSSAPAPKRLNAYLKAMVGLNEDTGFEIWKKIVQQINFVSTYWVSLDDKLGMPEPRESISCEAVRLHPDVDTQITTKTKLLGFLPFLIQVRRNNETKIRLFGIPILKFVNK